MHLGLEMLATIVTEIPHDLKSGATVEILNITSTNNTAGVAKSMFNQHILQLLVLVVLDSLQLL